jgi:hypothetical protein
MARLKGAVLGLSAIAWLTSAPVAMAFNHHITVYAQVPQMRNIYVNKSGLITEIVGNTSENVTPRIYNEDNQPQPMTDSIMQQYQQFLSQQKTLQASKIYTIKSSSEASQPKIDATLTLGSG